MICIRKALYRGHLDRIGWGGEDICTNRRIHFLFGLGSKFAEHKLTNGWTVTLGKKLINPMVMADIS